MIIGHGGDTVTWAARLGCRPDEITDMSSNMNPLGPPPGLIAHLRDALDSLTRLPEADAAGAVAAFSRYYDLPAEWVAAGNGTTQLIHLLPRALNTRRALILGPTYADYADACRQHGIAPALRLSTAPAGFQPDLDALAEAVVRHGADTVFVCNPNNPTGTLIPGRALAGLCAGLPRVRFVIDEAYLPFGGTEARDSLLARALPNAVVLHSMSKLFRVPGLRIGFLAAPPAIIARLRTFMMPWSVNSLAQAAIRFVLGPETDVAAFVRESVAFLEREKELLAGRLAALDWIAPFASRTSFVLARLSGGWTAPALVERLARERILIRDCSNFEGLSDAYVRVSLKTAAPNERLAQVLERLAAPPERAAGGGR